MFRKFNLMFQGLFLTVLVSSLVVACGKQDSRKRPATTGQKTTGDVTADGKNKTTDTSTTPKEDKTKPKTATEPVPAKPAAENKPAVENKPNNTTGEGKKEDAKTAVDTLAKFEQVYYELKKENPDKDFKAAFQKNTEILNKIHEVNLSMINGKVEFSVKPKVNEDSKEISIEVFEAQGVKSDDLKKGDVELKNSAADAKLKWNDVKLRILPSNEYLLRIGKNENEVLGLLFEDQKTRENFKLTHVLGNEKESATHVKNLGWTTESKARSEESSNKFVNITDEALAKLEKARVALEALDTKKILWDAIRARTMQERNDIVVQLKSVREKAASIREAKGADAQMMEQTIAGSLASIRSKIQLFASGLRAQINDSRHDEATRAGLTGALNALEEINLPELNLTSSGSKY